MLEVGSNRGCQILTSSLPRLGAQQVDSYSQHDFSATNQAFNSHRLVGAMYVVQVGVVLGVRAGEPVGRGSKGSGESRVGKNLTDTR